MHEALKQVASNSIEPVGKSVTLCVRLQRFRLNGIWNWEMVSPAVYCSDVMSFPSHFVGTKGLIHPDDLPKLVGALTLMEEKEVPRLDFRIITTYGEVKTISGQRVSIEDEKNKMVEPIPGKEPWEDALQLLAAQKENDFLHLRNELNEYTERLHGIGSWLINKQTGQAWYSDNVFRMFGLAPQSLNAHANTFNHFIHSDDRTTVLDAFEKAYQEQVPLHLEYRIVNAEGEVRYIQQITKWLYTVDGQQIFSGIARDVTGERTIANELAAAQTQVSLHQQVLKITEQQTATGYWLTDLATRKTSYSENYYRIYGFRQPFLPSYNSFINLVHSEDRSRVREHIEKMYSEHAIPEIEFRIIRPDGKQRYIKQSGKLFISPNKELIMIGLVQDISVQKGLEKKIIELTENIFLSKAVTEMTETAAETSSFIWLPDGYMQWSDGFYRMLGYKPGGVEPLPRFVYKNIHPADLKTFRDAEALLLNGQNHDDIIIRLVSKGGIKKVRISFRQVNYGKDATIALVHDISKQSDLSEQFANNKLFTELLEDSVKDMILFTNNDNTVLHWNKIAEEKTGIKKDDALRHNLFDVLPQLNEENFLGQIHLAIRGYEAYSARVSGVYLKRPHDYWLWPLKNEAGEVVGVLHVIQDISKQLELQQQLNERLNFIESLVESSVDRIVVLDRFMNYLYWNKKAEEYYAINKERVLGKNILEVFPSFRNNPGYQQFRTVLRGETVYLPPASEETGEYFETYLIPIKDESNEVTAVLWVVHDLTRELQLQEEQRKAQQQLQQEHLRLKEAQEESTKRRELLQATMDSTLDMIQVFEAVRNKEGEIVDFRYILTNHEAERLIPGSIGKSLLQLQPGVVEEGIFDAFKQVVETGVPQQYEKHYVHEQFNGWFYQSVVKLNDGVATTTTDITQRKKAEQEIHRLKDAVAQRATDKYHTLFNSIDEGFSIIELVFDENGKAVDFIYQENNPAFIKHVGVDWQGRRRSEVSHEQIDFLLQKYEHLSKTGEPLHFEYRLHTLGDQWFQVTATRIGEEGSKQLGVVFRNITERKHREQQQAYLLKLTDAIKQLSNGVEIQKTATRIIADEIDADVAHFSEVSADERYCIIHWDYRRNPDTPSVAGIYDLETFAKSMEHSRDGLMVVDDVESCSFFSAEEKAAYKATGISATLFFAFFREGKRVAHLILGQSTPRKWTDFEIALVKETAERTWGLVERAHAEAALLQSRQQLARELSDTKQLEQVSSRIIEENNIEQLYEAILDSAMNIMNAQSASIQILMPHRNELYLLASKNFHPQSATFWEYVNMDSSSGHGQAWVSGERVVIPDIENCVFLKKEEVEAYRLSGIASVQYTVLISRSGNQIGIISTYWKHKHQPTERELSLLDVLARQTADLIERRQADEALRINRERMHWQKEAFQSAVHGKPLEESLHILTQMVVEETKGEARTAFYMVNPDNDKLYTVRGAGNMPKAYADEIDGFLIGEETVACGLAVPTGRPVITPDVYREPRWAPWIFIADKHNYRGSWSFPIKTKEEKAVGTFAMYFQSPREATPQDLALADIVTQTAAVIISSHTDIQLREEAEEQLRKFTTTLEQQVAQRTKELQQTNADLENFKRMADAAHDAIIGLDTEGRVNYWNGAAENSFGYTNEEVLGRYLADLTVPEHKLAELRQLHEVVYERGEAVVDVETQRIAKDGKLIDVLISIFPLKDDGKIVGSCGVTKDITERKRSEEELKKNLTILQQTEQMAQTGSWVYEINSGSFHWSEGMYKLFGLPKQMKVQPEIYLDFAVEEDRSVAKRIVNQLRKKHKNFEEVMRIKRDGEDRLLRIKGSTVHDEEGKPQKIIGIDIDLTDIQKAEDKLKESQHWLEQTTKASPDSISVYDLRKKQPVYLNDCLAAWVGVSNEDLVAMGVEKRLRLVHPDDRLNLLHANQKVADAKDGEVITTEYRVETYEGKVIWLRNRSKPFLRDASGKVTHILSILQNVTEEVELREQLKQRTQFAEAILDASVDRIVVFDRNFKFVTWNKRCEQIHRKTREEVIGKSIFEVFPGVENTPEFIKSQELSLNGEFIHVPMVRDGYTGDYLELFYIPLKNAAGETYAVVNIMHDVSDYVITTEQLNALNKKLETKNIELEQKHEEITSFAFVASHDMKEPLRKIHTFSDWLLEQEIGRLSPKGKGLVEKIGASVHRMEILIEDILVLTKIHSDTHREEDVDLNKTLNLVLEDMAEQIHQTGTVINAEALPVIKANSNQLFYLFKNLISNAIKFQKPGNIPKLTIRSEIVDGSEVTLNEPREEYLKLSFADNGFGFDQRYTKKIFQVFQRLHGKHEFEGTGIGLAICKKIMENHNGTIAVQSEQGKGSVFSCFFPLN